MRSDGPRRRRLQINYESHGDGHDWLRILGILAWIVGSALIIYFLVSRDTITWHATLGGKPPPRTNVTAQYGSCSARGGTAARAATTFNILSGNCVARGNVATATSIGGGISNATSCPNPTGTITTVSPGANLTNVSNGLGPGDTLLLNNGSYTPPFVSGSNALWSVDGTHGTAANPIIIEAKNDGGATIDGTGGGNQDLMDVRNSSYIIFCGFNLRDSQKNVLAVGSGLLAGSAPTFPGSVNNLTFERIIARDGVKGHLTDGTGNMSCFHFTFNNLASNANVLFQDDAALGSCRYGFADHDVNGGTFRRDWAGGNEIPYTAFPAPRAGFNAYGAQNALFEDNVGMNQVPGLNQGGSLNGVPAIYSGQYITSADMSVFPSKNNTWNGMVLYNSCTGQTYTNTAAVPQTLSNVVLSAPSDSACTGIDGGQIGNDVGSGLSVGAPAYTNSVFANAGDTAIQAGSGGVTVRNSAVVNNGNAMGGSVTHSYNDFYNNGTNPSMSTGDITANPGYDTTTYGLGAYLMPAPNLTGRGQNGADIGADLRYETVNRTQTNIPLWPWPMEARIMAETGRSVTYAGNGGIWKTLSGVYP